MRIVVIGRFGIEAFGRHIAETFRGMGHHVVTCDPLSDVSLGWFDFSGLPSPGKKFRHLILKEMLSSQRYATSLHRTLDRMLKGNDCDLVLSTHDFLSPVALQLLHRAYSAKIALWFPDHAARLERAFMMSGLYDLMFFKDPFLVDRFRSELGLLQTHYLPECCRADLHSLGTSPEVTEQRDLGTAGNIHSARAVVLKKLIDEGYRVTVWGPPVAAWTSGIAQGIESQPFVANHDKVRAFRSCKIVLNTTHPAEVESTNVRTFEAAGAGAFQLVNHRTALESLFDIDEEIVTFRNLDELVDKVRHYLPRDRQRREIADRAQQRVLSQHTYEHRLSTILSMSCDDS